MEILRVQRLADPKWTSKEFALKHAGVLALAEIVRDADLYDDKYGPPEGAGIDSMLKAWANQQVSDEELLRCGMELIEILYQVVT